MSFFFGVHRKTQGNPASFVAEPPQKEGEQRGNPEMRFFENVHHLVPYDSQEKKDILLPVPVYPLAKRGMVWFSAVILFALGCVSTQKVFQEEGANAQFALGVSMLSFALFAACCKTEIEQAGEINLPSGHIDPALV